jgi:formylglycine-generating enzyme
LKWLPNIFATFVKAKAATSNMKNYTQTIPFQPANAGVEGSLSFNMIAVNGGQFDMGGESGYDDSLPVHKVEVSDFWIGEMLVTQDIWAAVMGNNPSYFVGQKRPVEQVSWEDITQKGGFLEKLNDLTVFTQGNPFSRPKGTNFRLPTEAEWEYAARGGAQGGGFPYSGSHRIHEVAWFDENSHLETKPVGLKLPNELGIYDMTGNVWEWCNDWYNGAYYQKCFEKGVVKNPTGAIEGQYRVYRGGSWVSTARLCRLMHRLNRTPSNRNSRFGFRLVLSTLSV